MNLVPTLRKALIKLSFILIVFVFSNVINAQQLAFPTATGAGAYATGGRGGIVVHVTNLNASGPGSFEAAIKLEVPRTIVFDVSGVININPLLYIGPESSNFTLAGQTAPEGGITIAGGRVYFAGVTNYIMRHIRFKGGFEADIIPNRPDLGQGSASFSNVGEINNVMVDHVSFGFGKTMPTWTKQGDQDETIDNTTIQRCFFSETNKGVILGQDVDQPTYRTAGDITFSKNVFYNVRYRTPNLTGNHGAGNSFDIINNLTWNAQGRIIRGAGDMNMNHLGNATHQRAFTLNDVNVNLYSQGWVPKIYTSGNIIYAESIGNLTNTLAEMNTDNTLSWKVFDFGGPNYGNQLPPNFFVDTPYPLKGETQTILNASELRTTLPNEVGCNARLNADGSVSTNLDTHDAEYLQNILNDVMVAPLSNYSIDPIISVSRPNDFYVSNPNIPEIWFQANVPVGLNHNDIAPSGYTYLEEYLNRVDGPIVSIGAESVTISPNTATLNVPETIVLSKTFTPANTTNQNGVWASSNESVATVSADGTVTSVSQGEATITFTSNDGGFSDSAIITVTNIIIDVESIIVSPNTLTLDLGEVFLANVDFSPANATNQDGTWTSSNPSIANVDVDGNITGLEEGNATITFTSSDNPSFTGDILVTVEDVFFGTYEFYNADTDQLIQLIEGDSNFDLNVIGDQVNFRSIPQGGDNTDVVESVGIEWTGVESGQRTENVPIYAGLNGHNNFDFLPYTVIEGTYNFTITYFSEDGASGDIVARDKFSLTFFFDNSLSADAGQDVSICQGESTTLTASGGTSYLWDTGETTASIDVNPILTTTYTVIVSDDLGDEDTDDVIVTVNDFPVADAGTDQTICEGNTITLTASGGTSYLWDTGETTASIDVNPSTNTVYSVEVSLNNCSSTDSVSVFVVDAPNLTVSNDIVIVNGQSTTLTVNGSDNYLWSTGETTSSILVSPTITTTYTVSSSGAENCEATEQVTVTVIPEVIADAGTDSTICNGESVTLNATGGVTYLWNTGDTTAELIVSPLITTTYTVTVEDDFGYTDTDTVTITVNETPDITVSGDVVIIDGESATLTANGSDNYQWNTGETSATIIVNPTVTTTYTVISTAVGGCADIEQVTVTVIPEVIADAGEDITICSGETLTLTASGGTTYLWNTGETSSNLTISPIITTIYTVTVEDDYGYSDTDSVTITVNATPNITVSNDIAIMAGESTTLTVTGSDNYLWSTGETQASILVSPSVTTSYSVSSSGIGGCEDVEEVVVTVIPELIANAGADVEICNGESVTLNASGGLTYTWNTGQTGSQLTVSPSVTTTYNVTVEDNFGNSDTDNVTITVNEMPTIEISENITIVQGENVDLFVSGAQTYLWNTGETSDFINVSPIQTTTYTVLATSNTCSIQAQVTVIVEDAFQASVGEDVRLCENYTNEVILTANEGDSYIWNTGETTRSIIVSPLATSTYIVTVTQGLQSDSDNVTVYVDPNPEVVILNGDNIDIMDGDFVTLSASGANSYEWSNGTTQPNIAVSPRVTTIYEVIGYIGECSDQKQITVNVIPEVIADAGEDVSICLDEVTTLIATGGEEYVWSTGETTQSIQVSPTVTTEYSVTVFNAVDFDEDTVTVEVDIDCEENIPTDDVSIDFEFDIFPNPASSIVNLKLSGTDVLTNVYLYDITGKLILRSRILNEEKSNSSTTPIDISRLQTGVYYIKLVDIHRDISKKLIVN